MCLKSIVASLKQGRFAQRATFRAEGRVPALRLRVPDTELSFEDLVRGPITFPLPPAWGLAFDSRAAEADLGFRTSPLEITLGESLSAT